MDTKEMTVSDLAREQIRKKKEKNNHIGVRRFWCW